MILRKKQIKLQEYSRNLSKNFSEYRKKGRKRNISEDEGEKLRKCGRNY